MGVGAWLPGVEFLLYLAQKLPRGQYAGQGMPLAIFHSSLREVEQVAVDGHKVGVAASQSPREPDQVFIVRVGFHGTSDYHLGRVPYDLGFVVQPAHVLGCLVVSKVPAELLPCQDRLQLIEQAG